MSAGKMTVRSETLGGDTRAVEEETDSRMSLVEQDAEAMILEGKQKLEELEERRRVSLSRAARHARRSPRGSLGRTGIC